MKTIFEEDAFFDCRSCGKCCRTSWQIPISEAKRKALRDFGSPSAIRQNSAGRSFLQRFKGRCSFLLEGELCGIHTHLGPEAKPLSCQMFPFVLNPTPEGYHVGLSHFCPAVREGHGRPLEAHQSDVGVLLTQLPSGLTEGSTIKLNSRVTMGWNAYKIAESEILTRLPSQLPSEVLLGLLQGLTVVGESWGKIAFEDYFVEPKTILRTQANELATTWARNLDVPFLNPEESPNPGSTLRFLTSLVRRKTLLKGKHFVHALAHLAVFSILLEACPETVSLVDEIEMMVSHGKGLSLPVDGLLL